jgi:hypothetical protein
MPYTAQRPYVVSSDELRARVPGWGVDLDVKNRPAVPRENFQLKATGAHWTFPERQLERTPRERSIEHQFLTPVFGTACPPRGASGAIRRYAYRFGEGRAARWLLLILADRVDVFESGLASLLRGRPEVPFLETGMRAQLRKSGLRSRAGQHRSNADLVGLAGKGLLLAGAAFGLARLIRASTTRSGQRATSGEATRYVRSPGRADVEVRYVRPRRGPATPPERFGAPPIRGAGPPAHAARP